MTKMNCWDAAECAVREQCPAYPNRGHVCFAVEGTLCKGEAQGAYGDKIRSCRTECEYYKKAILGKDE
jgi:hypothetical protein